MAEAEWTFAANSLDPAQVARGATDGVTPPGGGGAKVFGFRSDLASVGAVALYANGADFGPLKKNDGTAAGGSIRGWMKKGVGAGVTGYSPFLFCCLRSGIDPAAPSVNDVGYLLGFEDNNPAHLVFRKAAPADGFTLTGTNLRESSLVYAVDTWVWVRMDVIPTPHGDVRVKFFTSGSGNMPSWASSPMEDFVDDVLEANSGSTPLIGGFVGFGFWCNDSGRSAYFDRVEPWRQVK